MEILTDIPVTKVEAEFYKKFKNLSVNEEPKPQGEGVVRISPFDDYFIFTLYDEIDGVNSPIDLSNVGTIYMVFIGKTDEIRIPNYTNVQDINMSGGQVLFRIGKDDSQKILALDNRNFYISTMMVDPDGMSDESVVYTGTFLSFKESAKVSISKQLEDARLDFSRQLAVLQSTINSLTLDMSKKDNLMSEQIAVIDVLKQSNQNLSNEIKVLSTRVSSETAELILSEAQEAQAAEEAAKLNRQQIASINEVRLAEQTKSKKKAFFTQAVQQLRTNIPGVNTVTAGGSSGGGSNAETLSLREQFNNTGGGSYGGLGGSGGFISSSGSSGGSGGSY